MGELITTIGRRGQRANAAERRVDTEAARDKLQWISEGTANQFAMEKAIASGNGRLMRKAKLAANTARLKRLRAAYEDDQYTVPSPHARCRIRGQSKLDRWQI
ncbi:hypothetical protein [Agrobacterium tumefaciens]|uniref:hypothetical protein n=1 Tax=Agrobacterium tumefaciens TaxID=358 RepID=UPI000DDAE1E5|nr:hypothetical protein [Agrobacterium tumefaciens]NSZ87174.1 hypothetical protein [Agrobacterium tumefaciens]UXS99953.1 hypothetical protein FY143_24355 [Agrobacterium tumefaciens]WCA72380.1 hypothetical protein G6L97_25050 [Agrobacterium tumefaciens]